MFTGNSSSPYKTLTSGNATKTTYIQANNSNNNGHHQIQAGTITADATNSSSKIEEIIAGLGGGVEVISIELLLAKKNAEELEVGKTYRVNNFSNVQLIVDALGNEYTEGVTEEFLVRALGVNVLDTIQGLHQ